nr:hypothetical protein [Tanacetum cinerariifolium]
RVVKCYNCQGERHMARQCTQPKRPRNVAWYKDKAMLAEAQEARQILDEEQLAFLADPGVPDGQAVQKIIPTMLLFRLRILILMILTVMISRKQKRFSCLTFSTMVLTLSQRYLILKPIIMIWKIKEQVDILWGIVEQAKAKQPLDSALDFSYKHAQRIQELLVYVQDTCPNAIKLSAKKAAATPRKMSRKLGLKCSTSNYGSKPTSNKRMIGSRKHQVGR